MKHAHRWNVSIAEAVRLQKELAARVVDRDDFGTLRTIAGVDISTANERARAAVVVLSYPGLEPLEQATAERPLEFPYVPGLLGFREIPSILDALAKLRRAPDMIVADGQGRAHPRRLGLASHLGVILDRPTIGCAKSRLCGDHAIPAPKAGSWTALTDGGEVIGAALRTKDATNVVYVSIGHRVGLKSAIGIVLKCCTKYRIPQPTRLADRVAAGENVILPGTSKIRG
ncbi:MAG: deoxyribonuclease V [Planctomycetes bacterium]|nr:deoxyribonuclease V [Planctomycetota bacterium]